VDLIYSLWELIPRRVSHRRDRSGKPKLIDRNNLADALASHARKRARNPLACEHIGLRQ
jgi:hypothetical protein